MEKPGILIVEDEAIIAFDISIKVKQLGHHVAGIALTADEAIEIATRLCPQMVLMDIHLEGTSSGIITAKIIKKLCNNLPIIFISGSACITTIEQANFEGRYGYICKPFMKSDLKSQIDKMLINELPIIAN